MTSEEIKEAIKYFEDMIHMNNRLLEVYESHVEDFEPYRTEQIKNCEIAISALKMVISALSQPQGDLISRSEAIDITKWFFYPEMIAEQLKQLPSAQPDIEQIRQEIEQAKQKVKSIEFAGNSAYRFYNKGIEKSLSIIDKYLQKGESKCDQ